MQLGKAAFYNRVSKKLYFVNKTNQTISKSSILMKKQKVSILVLQSVKQSETQMAEFLASKGLFTDNKGSIKAVALGYIT